MNNNYWRTAYHVTVNYYNNKTQHKQYIKPNEIGFIKTWLNQDGEYKVSSVIVTKHKLTAQQYKSIFE